MNINEATKEEKLNALLSEISQLDEPAINDFLIDFFGWSGDKEDQEDYDLETDTKDHP